MEDLIRGRGIVIVGDHPTARMIGREAALAALYPDEPSGIHTTIRIEADPFTLMDERRQKRRAAEAEARRAAMLADFDRSHPTTSGDLARMAAAEAKRARRRARHQR